MPFTISLAKPGQVEAKPPAVALWAVSGQSFISPPRHCDSIGFVSPTWAWTWAIINLYSLYLKTWFSRGNFGHKSILSAFHKRLLWGVTGWISDPWSHGAMEPPSPWPSWRILNECATNDTDSESLTLGLSLSWPFLFETRVPQTYLAASLTPIWNQLAAGRYKRREWGPRPQWLASSFTFI